MKPFIEHCALAPLPGKGAFAGAILSHDFVEAALMRRAGWGVWIAYDLQHRLNSAGKGVTRLRGQPISPALVARAVTLMQALDREIRVQTHNKRSLDDVSLALMRMDKVNTESFVQLSESVLGTASEVLDTPLLR